MNTRRFVWALFGALAISGLCTLVLGRKITARSGRDPVGRIYVAVDKPIAAGEVLKGDDLKFIAWPANDPLEGAFTRIDAVVGRSAIYPIGKGQPVLEPYLAAPGSIVGLTTRIPAGMRAIALKSDEVIGVAGFLFPGARVDVLVTYHSYGSPDAATATVLEDALVVAVGHQIQPDPDGKPASVNVVTILAKPADAERVVLAGAQGTIHFVLRNGVDHAAVNLLPVNLSQFSAKAAAPLKQAGGRGTKSMDRKPKPYVVETILGAKASFATFN